MDPSKTFGNIRGYEKAGKLYKVVSFDPGGTTGWAVFCVQFDAMRNIEGKILNRIPYWNAGEFTGDENKQVDEMLGLVQAWDDAKIVMEDFVLRKFSMLRDLLAPVRVISAFTYGLHAVSDSRQIILQQPSLAMTTITDDRLRRLGYWTPLSGQPHARDAVRHSITWLRRAKEIMKIQVDHDEP